MEQRDLLVRCADWAGREPPRSLGNAPPAVTRHLRGTRLVMRALWALGAALCVGMAANQPTRSDQVATLLGVGLFVAIGMAALTRGLATRERRWLTQTPPERVRLESAERVKVRGQKGRVATVTELRLAPLDGAGPLYLYVQRLPEGVAVGHEVIALRRGPQAFVLGLGEAVLHLARTRPLPRA